MFTYNEGEYVLISISGLGNNLVDFDRLLNIITINKPEMMTKRKVIMTMEDEENVLTFFVPFSFNYLDIIITINSKILS